MSPTTPEGLVALLGEQLPSGSWPVSACVVPLHRHVLDSAPDDVEAMTRKRVAARFGDRPRVVVSLRRNELDPDREAELVELAERPSGGVVVLGVGYEAIDDEPAVPLPGTHKTDRSLSSDDECPECGGTDVETIGPSGAERPSGPPAAWPLRECARCGTTWDAG